MIRILGVTLAVVLVLILIAQCEPSNTPTTEPPDDSLSYHPRKYPLHAQVRLKAYSMLVSNEDIVDWTECRLRLNFSARDYGITLSTIPAQMTVPIALTEFSTEDGERFNALTHRVKNIYISCDTLGGRASYSGDFSE